MERLLALLPARPQPAWVRFGVTTLMVGLSFILVIVVRPMGGAFGFFLLYPAIFLATILFDRGTGFYAAGLSTAGLYSLLRQPGALLLSPGHLLTIAFFVVLSVALAWASEGLRMAWERAVQAERSKDLLLQELGHRTKNNLAMVTSLLTLQCRSSSNPDVTAALQNALSRIRSVTAAHDHVVPGVLMDNGVTEMRSYLEELCNRLGESLRGVRPIAIAAHIEPIELTTHKAIPLGLIVNELVTNALKYAFPDERAGTISVKLERSGNSCVLTVEDDGIGCAQTTHSGLGSRLIPLFVQQLGGTMTRTAAAPGCKVVVEFVPELQSR